MLWVSGQWKINVTKYELIIYHWLANLMQSNFYKRSAIWKFVVSKLFWNTHVKHATLIFMHIFSTYMNVKIVCLKVSGLFLYIKRVWNRYCIELCCISMFILLRGIIFTSAEKPNLQYTWIYSPAWHFCKL